MEKKRNIIIRVVFLFVSIIIGITIFVFSNQDSNQSKQISEGFTKRIIDVLPKTKNLSEMEKQKIVKESQKIVRKLAHFSIYAILGMSVMLFLKTFSIVPKKQMLFTLGICFIYASLDEVHQIFTEGRTPLITDVGIDVLGGILGASIISLPLYISKKIKAI